MRVVMTGCAVREMDFGRLDRRFPAVDLFLRPDQEPELVDRFREKFPNLPKPVYAHCKSGKRAGAMVMMHDLDRIDTLVVWPISYDLVEIVGLVWEIAVQHEPQKS